MSPKGSNPIPKLTKSRQKGGLVDPSISFPVVGNLANGSKAKLSPMGAGNAHYNQLASRVNSSATQAKYMKLYGGKPEPKGKKVSNKKP